VIKIDQITQALVLAGGEGTRLKPITKKIPKPMIEIHGKPFLEYQLELLAKNGITDVVLGVGYLWEQIKDYFGNNFNSRSGEKVKLRYSVEPRFIGTGGAVKLAEPALDDLFFIVYGDSYLPIDYQTLGQAIFQDDILGVLSVYNNQDKLVNNNVIVNDDGFIQKYDKQHPEPDMNGVEAGANVFKKDLLRHIPEDVPENQKISLEVDIYPKLIKNHQLISYMTDIRFYDIGTFERLEIFTEVIK
jgi:NDP-sugar pyrophosphorylase family protein